MDLTTNVFANLHSGDNFYSGFIIPVQFNGCHKTFRALVDTGADNTLISSLVLHAVQQCKKNKPIDVQSNWPARLHNFGIRDASGNKMKIEGYANSVEMFVPSLSSSSLRSGTVTMPPGIPIIDNLTPEIILGHDALELMSLKVEYGPTRDKTSIKICGDNNRECQKLNMGEVRRQLMQAQRHPSSTLLLPSTPSARNRRRERHQS